MSALEAARGAVRRGGGLAGLLLAAFVAKLGVALWGVNRGYEMGDEGTFLLSLNHPAHTPAAFEIYKLLAPLDLHFGVVELRLLRIGVELAASLALVGGLVAWARRRLFGGAGLAFSRVLLFALLGGLVSVASRSFSYNDMTNLCTYTAVGGLLGASAFAGEAAPRRRRLLARGLALAAGLLAGLQLTVKFPPAILFWAGSAGVLLLGLPFLGVRERLRLLACQAAGTAAMLALVVLGNGGVAPLVEKYRATVRVAELAEYGPLSLLGRYVGLEIPTYLNLAVLLGVFGVARAVWRRVRPETATAGAVGIAAVALAASTALTRPFYLHFSLLYLSCLLAFAFGLLGLLGLRRAGAAGETTWPPRRRELLPLLLPAALPLVNFMGTNVPFTMRLPSHALPAFAALAVLSEWLSGRRGCKGLHGVLAAAGLAATSGVFLQHHLLEPYGLREPLYAQTQPVEGLPGVRVDLASKRFLEASAERMRAAGFRPGDPIVAFHYMPGLVHYLGGVSPQWPFYMFDKPQLNCFNLNRAPLERTPYLILGREMSEEQRACIEAFDFPRDFRRVGVLRFPYQEVYAGWGARDLSHVRLYAPRSSGASADGRSVR